MRRILPALFLILAACGRGDCLPAPSGDASGPIVRLVVDYHVAGTGDAESFDFTLGDSSTTIVADARRPLQITFLAEDAEGVRRLQPGLTVQHTVGMGVERQRVGLDPATASCPVPSLQVRHEVPSIGDPRVLILSAAAENWSGMHAAIEPLSIRLEHTRGE